jgi:DNA processing protein
MSNLSSATHSGTIRATSPGDWRNDLFALALAAPRPEPLALSLVDRFTAVRSLEKIAILAAAPTVDRLLTLDHYGVERIIGHTIPRARWTPRTLLQSATLDEAWLRRRDSHIVWFGDPGYPAYLRRVFDPPAVLYGWGTMAALDGGGPAIAMVGTRNPDDDGRISAFDLGGASAARGMTVVSGLAIGIDAASHRGVLASGCGDRAIAVLGSGIDTIYPGRNREVAGAILDAGGLLLSEYPPGTPPRKYQFPARNRIIAGLSNALVLFQAPEDSGSLITVSFALQIGLSVLIHRSGAEWSGGRALIADGAPVIDGLDGLLDELVDAGVVSPHDVIAADAPLGTRAVRVDGAELLSDEDRRKLALFGSVSQPESVDSWRDALRAREVAI